MEIQTLASRRGSPGAHHAWVAAPLPIAPQRASACARRPVLSPSPPQASPAPDRALNRRWYRVTALDTRPWLTYIRIMERDTNPRRETMTTIPGCAGSPQSMSVPETVHVGGDEWEYVARDEGTHEVVGRGYTPAEARAEAEAAWDGDGEMPAIRIISERR